MPFCTSCGASLDGAFCRQCGAAVRPAAPAAPPPPVARRTSPVVVVLVVLLCLFGLGVVGVLGAGAVFWHRARRAGVDMELFHRNPGLALGRMIAASHPDLELLDTDRDAGMFTLRDRRTGKRFSMSFDDARQGRFSLRADDSEGHRGSLEIGDGASLPSWIPRYPGSNPTPVITARGESDADAGEAGDFTFETPDSPSAVLAFYELEAGRLRMTLEKLRVDDTLTLAASSGNERFFKVIAVADSDRTKVNVTYGRKR